MSQASVQRTEWLKPIRWVAIFTAALLMLLALSSSRFSSMSAHGDWDVKAISSAMDVHVLQHRSRELRSLMGDAL